MDKYVELAVKTFLSICSLAGVIFGTITVFEKYYQSRNEIAKQKSVGEEAIKSLNKRLDEIERKIADNKEDVSDRFEQLHKTYNEMIFRITEFLSKKS